MIDLSYINEYVESAFEDIRNVRRTLHMNPELGCAEFETQALIMDFLDKEGIEYTKIADTGVLGIIKGLPGGKVVAMRADIDALPVDEKNDVPYKSKNPGIMHACGHDAHTAVALGCARFFARNKDKFTGTVKLFFQPAEESSGGAERMVQQGCLENPKVDYVTGLHVMPYYDYNHVEVKHGSLNASTDSMRLTVKGFSGHGAYPDMCVDAIVIAAHIITALQTAISRSISPLDSGVVTIGKIEGGTAGNVIAGEVKLTGTVRSADNRIRDILFSKVKSIARGVAESMGGQCEAEIFEGYLPLVNDSDVIDVIENAAVEILGREQVTHKEKPSMGGEDFSFFNQDVKGAFYSIGCRLQDRPTPYSLHNDLFDMDERCLKTGMAVQIYSAIKLMNL